MREELVCQRETLDEILAVLALCTDDTQRERFLPCALYDFSYAEIAEMCGCSKVSVCQSIMAFWATKSSRFLELICVRVLRNIRLQLFRIDLSLACMIKVAAPRETQGRMILGSTRRQRSSATELTFSAQDVFCRLRAALPHGDGDAGRPAGADKGCEGTACHDNRQAHADSC